MGQPIGSASPISAWTEDDLLQWMRLHMAYTPGGFQTDSVATGDLHVKGNVSLTNPISYKGMTAPTVVSAASGPGFLNGATDSPTSGVAKVQYSIDPFKWVHLRGTARVTAANFNNPIFMLPPGYRPDKIVTVACHIFDVTAATWTGAHAVQIGTDGNVTIVNGTSTNPVDCHFDSVKFPLVTNT